MENGSEREAKRVRLASAFAQLDTAPPVPVFHLLAQFQADPVPFDQKVNLSVGGEPFDHVYLM